MLMVGMIQTVSGRCCAGGAWRPLLSRRKAFQVQVQPQHAGQQAKIPTCYVIINSTATLVGMNLLSLTAAMFFVLMMHSTMT